MQKLLQPPSYPLIVNRMCALAGILQKNDFVPESEALWREVLPIQRTLYGDHHPIVAAVLSNLARAQMDLGQHETAARGYREALGILAATVGEEHLEYAAVQMNLGGALRELGQLDEAEEITRTAVDSARRRLGSDHPRVAIHLAALAEVYERQGRIDDTVKTRREAIELERRTLGPDHPELADTLNSLAVFLRRNDRSVEAEPLFQETIAICRKANNRSDSRLTAYACEYVRLLRDADRNAEAEALAREALGAALELPGPPPRFVSQAAYYLATVLAETDRHAEALPYFEQALEAARRGWPGDDERIAGTLNRFGRSRLDADDPDRAEILLDESLGMIRRAAWPMNQDLARAWLDLGRVKMQKKQFAEALPLLDEFGRAVPQVCPPDSAFRGMAALLMGVCQLKLNDPGAAEMHFLQSLSESRAAGGDSSTVAQASMKRLVEIYEKSNRLELAEPMRALIPPKESSAATDSP
jgi:tetratricopeptide (TPR) repeat protein